MGMASFPDTVGLMVESDVLITDWSSIATNFHGLGRPVVFWDRPCPFSDLRMTPEDRVGPVVGSIDELVEVLDIIASDDTWFAHNYGSKQQELLERVHEAGLDGRAGSRLVEFLSSEALA
jgi:CDP-glycerol glycerophosphotransferase (TagB/SpsB family)